ncbi:MAG: hypothetical protein OEL87_00035 [Nanoarchaeota archaeon]|nr:hypothetical protein [Nanoarchaeota archaeon]
MVEMLDANIFVLSIYDSTYLKAVKKFISSNGDPLPYSLFNEISSLFSELHILFLEIRSDLKRDVPFDDIQALKDLNNNFDNIVSFLKNKSKDFKDRKSFFEVLDRCLDRIHSIDAWVDTVSRYPDTQTKEREIINKKRALLGRLKKIDGLHNSDLKIIAILNNFYRNNKEKVLFVTRDNGIYKNKSLLQKYFPSVKIGKISSYVSD